MEDKLFMEIGFGNTMNITIYRMIDGFKSGNMVYNTDSLSDISEIIKEYMKENGM